MNKAVPKWPRWYCSKIVGHWGYLREVHRIDDEQSEYICQACGGSGVRKRPPNEVRWYWF
jgi:hypothetical protein